MPPLTEPITLPLRVMPLDVLVVAPLVLGASRGSAKASPKASARATSSAATR